MVNIKNVMERIMKLQEFEVMVEIPEGFEFYGPVPYDMYIVGGIAIVKVVAVDIEEATCTANYYFNSNPYE
jgi:hypothetical protein